MCIIGIDEVGRGALAGPVTAAVVLLPRNFQFPISNFQTNPKSKNLNSKLKLKDSKKLTPKQREIWFRYIKESQKSKTKGQRLYYATANVSPKIIDKINISKAANLAAARAFNRLFSLKKLKIQNCKIFLDGGLYLNKNSIRINQQNQLESASTIIKGDEKINAIKLASVVAKVTRDRYMVKLRIPYPKYGFDIHKGYGTKSHLRAIRRYGLSDVHRKSFR